MLSLKYKIIDFILKANIPQCITKDSMQLYARLFLVIPKPLGEIQVLHFHPCHIVGFNNELLVVFNQILIIIFFTIWKAVVIYIYLCFIEYNEPFVQNVHNIKVNNSVRIFYHSSKESSQFLVHRIRSYNKNLNLEYLEK